jgi:hypothetical protein
MQSFVVSIPMSTHVLGALKAIKLKTGINQSFHGCQASWASANYAVLTHRTVSVFKQLATNLVCFEIIALHPHLR